MGLVGEEPVIKLLGVLPQLLGGRGEGPVYRRGEIKVGLDPCLLVKPYPPQRDNGNGGLTVVMVVAVFLLILGLLWAVSGGGGSSVAPSTVAREPLPAGAVRETGWYTAELGCRSAVSAKTLLKYSSSVRPEV